MNATIPLAEPRLNLGSIVRLVQAGDYAKARATLLRIAPEHPRDAQLQQLLGHACLNLGQLAEAIAAYEKAVSLAPGDAATSACLALALQLAGKSAPAKMAAHRALAIDPHEIVALKVMARVAVDQQAGEEALAWCDRLAGIAPTDTDLANLRDAAESIIASATRTLADLPDENLRQHLQALLDEVGFRRLQKIGFHLQANDYYSPLNDCKFLEENLDLWTKPNPEPVCINWRRAAQLTLAGDLSPFIAELCDVPTQPPADQSAYGWKNNFWENADALVQYSLVRHFRPTRYVEIGCGWSSLMLKRALARNATDGAPCAVTLIEPYPNENLFRHFPPDWTIHLQMIQRADPAIFESLEAGDVLFYDGSHCSKVASDVNWFFFEVLPRVKPGVIIHLHDISLPQEYPHPWIFDRGQTWNEQYVLQAFLMHNPAYEVLIANRYLFMHHAAELKPLYHNLQPVFGSSFWMHKVAA
jgi:tetratricopeptide (TPR) repeat protein